MSIRWMPTRWNVIVGGVVAAATATVASVAFAGGGGVACGCSQHPAIVDTVPGAPVESVPGRTITVDSTGTVQVDPDTAVVNLGVQVTASTGAEAMTTVNTDVAALTEALVAAGFAEEDIQTSGLSLYSTTGDDGTTVTGYNASLTLNVTVRDIEAVGPTIDAAQAAGGEGFTIGGVTFSFADPESVLGQARVDALANATAKAEQYAAAVGAELGDVIAIVESPSSMPILYADEMAASDMAMAAPTPISPGQLDLTIEISATFAIR